MNKVLVPDVAHSPYRQACLYSSPINQKLRIQILDIYRAIDELTPVETMDTHKTGHSCVFDGFCGDILVCMQMFLCSICQDARCEFQILGNRTLWRSGKKTHIVTRLMLLHTKADFPGISENCQDSSFTAGAGGAQCHLSSVSFLIILPLPLQQQNHSTLTEALVLGH